RVEHYWNDGHLHFRLEKIQGHHGAVIEIHLLRMTELEAVCIAMLEQARGELRVAGNLAPFNLEPRLDRPFKSLCAADAERSDVVEKEIRPVLRCQKQKAIRLARLKATSQVVEAARHLRKLLG